MTIEAGTYAAGHRERACRPRAIRQCATLLTACVVGLGSASSIGHAGTRNARQGDAMTQTATNPMRTPPAGSQEVIRPFRVNIPEKEIVELRKRMKVSQSAFAMLLNISTKTVQKWEQGENQPNGSSLKLLTIAKKNPKMLYVD